MIVIVQSRRMGWTERVARMEDLIKACKIWIGTLKRKRLLETSWCMSNIKMDDRETEHEDLVVIHLIQWGNERLCCTYSERCID
jgi:hypothetical protein